MLAMHSKDLLFEFGDFSFNPNQSGRQWLQCEAHGSRESFLTGTLPHPFQDQKQFSNIAGAVCDNYSQLGKMAP